MKKIEADFGSYIRRLRMKNDIGQRELAKKIGVAPSYLNDIEKNKRTAPRIELIKKLSVILKADLDLLYDLAGNSKKTVAPDIVNFIENNPRIISLLRAAKNNKLSDDEIEELEKKDGCTIYDPHVYTIEDGGMKEIDTNQIDFKKRADPFGLMNPGKTKGWLSETTQSGLLKL